MPYKPANFCWDGRSVSVYTRIPIFVSCRKTCKHATPRHAMPCHAMPCHAMPCHATPGHATPCHAMPRHATPCHATPCHAMPCHAMPRHASFSIRLVFSVESCKMASKTKGQIVSVGFITNWNFEMLAAMHVDLHVHVSGRSLAKLAKTCTKTQMGACIVCGKIHVLYNIQLQNVKKTSHYHLRLVLPTAGPRTCFTYFHQ